ncbi:MAG TPA: hypothetical protein VER17_14725, partial [Tepidisphaeraceae bacterium]|nr:hypothetical protein [Tepidisphaeraceae bacterium]
GGGAGAGGGAAGGAGRSTGQGTGRSGAAAPVRVRLVVGAVLAGMTVAVGALSQALFAALAAPAVAIAVAAVVTAALPLAAFPLVARLLPSRPRGTGNDALPPLPVTGSHVAAAAIAAVLSLVVTLAAPEPARANFTLSPRALPGLAVALPQGWAIGERTELIEYGTLKLDDPRTPGRSVVVQWAAGDPVQPDEHVNVITGGQLAVRERTATFVSGHQGVTYLVGDAAGNAARAARAAVTIWNCPQDRRVVSIVTGAGGAGGGKSMLLAAHRPILASVQCHTSAAAEGVLPAFVPPPGYRREAAGAGGNTAGGAGSGGGGGGGGGLLFTGPKQQTILFNPGAPGRSRLTEGDVPEEVVASLVRQVASLDRLEDRPALRPVHDLLGHERRVWSAAGASASGAVVQVEVMVWYCDRRNMTFIGGYATRGKHGADEGIDALLPAGCHGGSDAK